MGFCAGACRAGGFAGPWYDVGSTFGSIVHSSRPPACPPSTSQQPHVGAGLAPAQLHLPARQGDRRGSSLQKPKRPQRRAAARPFETFGLETRRPKPPQPRRSQRSGRPVLENCVGLQLTTWWFVLYLTLVFHTRIWKLTPLLARFSLLPCHRTQQIILPKAELVNFRLTLSLHSSLRPLHAAFVAAPSGGCRRCGSR